MSHFTSMSWVFHHIQMLTDWMGLGKQKYLDHMHTVTNHGLMNCCSCGATSWGQT